MNNEIMRRKFNEYYKKHHEPRLKLVASELNISKNYLVNWKNGKLDISTEALSKIDKFLDKYSK